jgi:hypothetical protein
MFCRSWTCAFSLAAALMVATDSVRAADEAKFPNWKGQWLAINPPFGDQIIKFDPTKRSGPWQQAPLTRDRANAGIIYDRTHRAAFARNRNRYEVSLPIRRNRQLTHLRLPPPHVNLVGVNIMAARKLGNAQAGRSALRNNPQLLGRSPTPPPFTTAKYRNARHVCPLTCQLTSTRSHA